MKKLTSLLLAAALLVGSMGLLAAPAAAATVAPVEKAGIVLLGENITPGGDDLTGVSILRGNGFLLETTADKDSVVTIQVNPTAANLTYKIPVKAGQDLVNIDFDEITSGNRVFHALMYRNNLTLRITADQTGVVINKLSYYDYAYLLDLTAASVTEVLRGDVNLNGTVEVTDALEALRAAVQLTTLEGDALKAADLDGKDGVTVADALGILRIAVGLDA